MDERSIDTYYMDAMQNETGYLNARAAHELDKDLLAQPGFCLEQLLELEGLSVAQIVYELVHEQQPENSAQVPHVLFVCGPGNNGGDGMVAARHLVMFGYQCTVVYPRQSKKAHSINLLQQLHDNGVPVLPELPQIELLTGGSYDAIVDAIFGWAVRAAPREPFCSILERLRQAANAGVLTVSVDLPSGWTADDGDVANIGFVPDALISLVAPKRSVAAFGGRHFVGGRFLPLSLAQKYGLRLPDYPGISQYVEVIQSTDWSASNSSNGGGRRPSGNSDSGRKRRSGGKKPSSPSKPSKPKPKKDKSSSKEDSRGDEFW